MVPPKLPLVEGIDHNLSIFVTSGPLDAPAQGIGAPRSPLLLCPPLCAPDGLCAPHGLACARGSSRRARLCRAAVYAGRGGCRRRGLHAAELRRRGKIRVAPGRAHWPGRVRVLPCDVAPRDAREKTAGLGGAENDARCARMRSSRPLISRCVSSMTPSNQRKLDRPSLYVSIICSNIQPSLRLD